MLKCNRLKFRKRKYILKRRRDILSVIELKSDGTKFEYIVINEAYQNFKKKDKFCTSITLIFNKGKFDDAIERDKEFNRLEFKLKEYISSKGGSIIFIYRKEKEKAREVLFYTTRNMTHKLKIYNFYKLFDFSEEIDIVIKKDENWKLASKYIE